MNPVASALTVRRFGLILVIDVLESIAEVCFKSATTATGFTNVTPENFLAFALRLLGTPMLWLGIAGFVVILCLWLTVLAKVDLSVAFPLGNAVYLIIPFLSMVVLHEHLSVLRWLGTAFVLAGGYCVSVSAARAPD